MSEERVSLDLPASLLKLASREGRNEQELAIRPLAIADAAPISAAIEASLAELKEFMPWAHFPQTPAVQRARIARAFSSYWRGEDYTLGIFDAKNGAVLGGSGLHRRTLNQRGLEIGYWVHSRHAGRGIATRMTRALIVYGFEYLKLDRIQCGHDAENTASARVIQKCGFALEGKLEKFTTAPTPTMLQDRWRASGTIHLYGIGPEGARTLDWYEATRATLTVYDWLGEPV